MIRVAETQDFKNCQYLLKQIGSSEKIDPDYLYLNDRTHGFTLVVERDTKLVALSTWRVESIVTAPPTERAVFKEASF